jgi:hypothetical protein
MVVTPRWLIWATSGNKCRVVASSVPLTDIEVIDYEDSPYYQFVEDCGIEILSLQAVGVEHRKAFIGLGKESAARRFRYVLSEAVRRARHAG